MPILPLWFRLVFWFRNLFGMSVVMDDSGASLPKPVFEPTPAPEPDPVADPPIGAAPGLPGYMPLAELIHLITFGLPDNNSELITPQVMRDILQNMIYSSYPGAFIDSVPPIDGNTRGRLWVDESWARPRMMAWLNGAYKQVGTAFSRGTIANLPPFAGTQYGDVYEASDTGSVFISMQGGWRRFDGASSGAIIGTDVSSATLALTPNPFRDKVVLEGYINIKAGTALVTIGLVAQQSGNWIDFAGIYRGSMYATQNNGSYIYDDNIKTSGAWSNAGASLSPLNINWKQGTDVHLSLQIDTVTGESTITWELAGMDTAGNHHIIKGFAACSTALVSPMTLIGVKNMAGQAGMLPRLNVEWR